MDSSTILTLLSYDNPVLRNYCFWTSILVIKLLLMSIITLIHRWRTHTAASPEDTTRGNLEMKSDPAVDRSLRAHHNDLENVLPYILISFVYMLTDPIPDVAINLFRVAVAFRLWHTIVYAIYVVPQPARAIGFFVPFIITIYMAVQSAIVFVN